MLFYLISPVLIKLLNSWKKCILSVFPMLIVGVFIPDGIMEPLKGLNVFVLGMAIFYAITEKRVMETALIFVLMGLLFYIPGFSYPYGDGFFIGAIILLLLASQRDYRIPYLNNGVDFINRHSYTIYLFHIMVIVGVSNVIDLMDVTINGYCFAAVVVVMSLCGVWIIDSLFEIVSVAIQNGSLMHNKKLKP